MPDLKDLLEQKSRRVAPTPGGFDRLVHRRARRDRNRRIGAGALAVLVTAAVVAALVSANQDQERPAGPSPTTSLSPSPGPIAIAGLPAAGAKPTKSTNADLAVVYDGPDGQGNEMDLSVFTDGRMVWQRWSPHGDWANPPARPLTVPPGATPFETGYVWQRLTPDGVNRMRSAMLAAGLFDGHRLRTIQDYQVEVRIQGRLIWGGHPAGQHATAAQLDALHALQTQMADPASWLPAADWADEQIHPFVPACYAMNTERGGVDLSKLPADARDELRQHMHNGYAHGAMPTDRFRILFRALIKAGYTPKVNSAPVIGFELPAAETDLFDFNGLGFLHFSPCLSG